MYCRHCGERMNENQAICVKCGVPAGKGDMYCANCGKEVTTNAAVCISCGYQINDIRNVHSDEENHKPKRKFAIGFTVIAALTTILLLIPHYLFIYGYYSKNILYYSFIEWMEGMSVIVLLLLWANPIISFVGLKQKRNYGLIKIVISIVLIILVFFMSIDAGDGVGSMFLLTMMTLLAQVIFSIVEALASLTFNKSTQSHIKSNTMLTVNQSTTTNNRIFCRNCGVEMNVNQAICIKCGVSVGNGNSYCSNCGNAVSENAEFCIHCGVAIKSRNNLNQNSPSGEYPGGQDKTSLSLICFFLGGFGVHHFIMGEQKKGIMKIALCFVFGVSGILALIDFVKILTDKYEVNYDTYF